MGVAVAAGTGLLLGLPSPFIPDLLEPAVGVACLAAAGFAALRHR
jgi:hypothetical protein